MEFIVLSSIALQFAAGFLALRLVAFTNRNWAWTLLSAGVFLMAFRRVHTFFEYYYHGIAMEPYFEILGLCISILLLLGIYLIGPLLHEMNDWSRLIAESEERYRTVAMFTHDWEYWMSPDGWIEYVSPSCERISGYGPEEFIADPQLFFKILHPEDREQITTTMSIVEKVQTPLNFDCRIQTKNGMTRWVSHNSVPVKSAYGTFLGTRGSIRDISHRKQIEQELKESQAMYEGMIENAHSMVLRLDALGRVTYACQYALDHFEVQSEDILGKKLVDVFQNAGSTLGDGETQILQSFLTTGTHFELEIDTNRSDGMVRWGEWVGSAVRDDSGDIYFLICVGIDVTRRKALDKLKEDVSRIVRHDLKSPLSGIIGIPGVMMRDENLTPKQVQLLKAVEDAGTVMLDLINQSLNLYKLETGTYDLEMTDFDLIEMIRNIADHLQISRNNKIPVILTGNGAPLDEAYRLTIRSDRPLAFSLFSNLIKNAIEASCDEPVTVDVTRNGECAVTIHNAGVVPDGIRDTFFGKYVTCGKRGGTGLGTYSARLITNQLGGTITMRSAEGEGTTLTVTLPGGTDG